MSENKEPLPVCRLCGNKPVSSEVDDDYVEAWCKEKGCVCYGTTMPEDTWRALMSPPVVTDAMVERAEAYIRARSCGVLPKTAGRAVLEAALKE